MTPARGSRGRTDPGPGVPGPGSATLRGALLVAVAVVVGIVLLAKGFESGTLPTRSPTPSEEASGDEGEGSTATSTSTTVTPTTHVAAQVRVQVLNATGPQGAAGSTTTALAAAGYATLEGANAGDRSSQVTVIYAAEGFEADAAAIAALLNVTSPVQAMPAPPPAPAPPDVHVVVLLGADFTPPA